MHLAQRQGLLGHAQLLLHVGAPPAPRRAPRARAGRRDEGPRGGGTGCGLESREGSAAQMRAPSSGAGTDRAVIGGRHGATRTRAATRTQRVRLPRAARPDRKSVV